MRTLPFVLTLAYLQVIKHMPSSESIQSKIKGTIILLLVLYGYETWSLVLREEDRLTAFKNSVLRKTFGSEEEEVKGG